MTLKKGAPGVQVRDLLCVQLASYLERGPLMWMMNMNVNQKFNYDDDDFLSSGDFFFKINVFEKFFQEYHQSFNHFGSRSGQTLCQA